MKKSSIQNLQKPFKAFYQSSKRNIQNKDHKTRRMQSMSAFYSLLFLFLILECILFVLVSILPSEMQKLLVGKLTEIAKRSIFWKILIVFCLLLGIFFMDLRNTVQYYEEQKRDIRNHISSIASELRRGYLSFTILYIERNMYILFTLFFVTIVTCVYLKLLNFYYRTQESRLVLQPKNQTENSFQQVKQHSQIKVNQYQTQNNSINTQLGLNDLSDKKSLRKVLNLPNNSISNSEKTELSKNSLFFDHSSTHKT